MAIPTDLANLELWTKSDTGVYKDAGVTLASALDTAQQWNDLSGNARNITQATSARRARLATKYIPLIGGGQAPCMGFDGVAQQYFDVPNFLTAFTAGEMIVVLRALADPGLGASSRPGSWHFGTDNSGDAYVWSDGNVYDSFGTTARKVFNPTPALNVWRVYDVYSAAGDFGAFVDNASVFTTATNTVGWTTTPTFGRGAGPLYFDGWVAELMLFSRKLTTTERGDMYAYLTGRYDFAKANAEVTTISGVSVESGAVARTTLLRGVSVESGAVARETLLRGVSIDTGGQIARVTRLAGYSVESVRPRKKGMPWFIG